eukprot:TRINITY_DN1393_c0_g2_i1.p1 TRINITY_DN1393_c0_g2~~TRINITY_DN1393_c0_g2_i1.p1  ORF type:complete len:1185 (-),score=334.86 TRINITY_DN1393_c0_g2_i1:25-3102(-)
MVHLSNQQDRETQESRHELLKQRLQQLERERLPGDISRSLQPLEEMLEDLSGRVAAREKFNESSEEANRQRAEEAAKRLHALEAKHESRQQASEQQLRHLERQLRNLEQLMVGEGGEAAVESAESSLPGGGLEATPCSASSLGAGSLADRLCWLEHACGSSARELQDLSRQVEQLQSTGVQHASRLGGLDENLEERIRSLNGRLSEMTTQQASWKTLQEGRLAALEEQGSQLGASTGLLQRSQAGVSTIKAHLEEKQAALAERLDQHEVLHGQHSATSKALQNVQGDVADIMQLRDRLVEAEARCDAAVQGFQRLQAQIGEERSAQEKHRGALQETLESLHDEEARHVEELMGKLEQLQVRVSTCEQHGETLGTLQRRHASQLSEQDARSSSLQSLQERLDYLELSINTASKQQQSEAEVLHAVQGSQTKHACELSSLKEALGRQEGLVERVARLEENVGSSTERTADKLDEAASAIDKVHQRLAEHEQGDHGSRLETLEGATAAFQQQLSVLAKLQEGSVAMEGRQTNVEKQQGTLLSRLQEMERATKDASEGLSSQGKELQAARSRQEELSSQLDDCRKTLGRCSSELGDRKEELAALAKEKAKLAEDRDSLKDAMGDFETRLKAAREATAADLREVRTKIAGQIEAELTKATSKMTTELSALAGRQQAFADQVLPDLQQTLSDQSLAIAKRIDMLEAADSRQDALLTQLRSLARASGGSSVDGTSPVASAAPVDPKVSTQCAKCGNIYAADSHFCRKCGAQRPKASDSDADVQGRVTLLSREVATIREACASMREREEEVRQLQQELAKVASDRYADRSELQGRLEKLQANLESMQMSLEDRLLALEMEARDRQAAASSKEEVHLDPQATIQAPLQVYAAPLQLDQEQYGAPRRRPSPERQKLSRSEALQHHVQAPSSPTPTLRQPPPQRLPQRQPIQQLVGGSSRSQTAKAEAPSADSSAGGVAPVMACSTPAGSAYAPGPAGGAPVMPVSWAAGQAKVKTVRVGAAPAGPPAGRQQRASF